MGQLKRTGVKLTNPRQGVGGVGAVNKIKHGGVTGLLQGRSRGGNRSIEKPKQRE